jgi:hypothetical protein
MGCLKDWDALFKTGIALMMELIGEHDGNARSRLCLWSDGFE